MHSTIKLPHNQAFNAFSTIQHTQAQSGKPWQTMGTRIIALTDRSYASHIAATPYLCHSDQFFLIFIRHIGHGPWMIIRVKNKILGSISLIIGTPVNRL